jgi:hypothetical protein
LTLRAGEEKKLIEKQVQIIIPFLWNGAIFQKKFWGDLNYIVGANGSGKSLLAEQLKNQINGGGLNVRYLNAERLTGLEKQEVGYYGGGSLRRGFDIGQLENYKNQAESSGLSSSAIIILKQRLDVRTRIEATLSDIFGKTIRLDEQGGYLKAKMQNILIGEEYGLSEGECHGLKELITLLTFLYDPTKNCIIFDEPELHLHPQYQSFFLQEMRKLAGNPLLDPGKKMFFIITHSPYFLDLKTLEDLKNVIVCQRNHLPTFVEIMDQESEYVLSRFLPRFNTHHKQFFFSSNPVFVEGYTDQQILSILLEKVNINIGASGSCIIDVGGKDELAVFKLLCQQLSIDSRVIADLDAIFRGKLRQTANENPKTQEYVQKSGIGTNLSQVIGEFETKLSELLSLFEATTNIPHSLDILKNELSILSNEEIHTKRLCILKAIETDREAFLSSIGSQQDGKLRFIEGRLQKIIEAFAACRIYILPKGEVEHYYKTTLVQQAKAQNKDILFHSEREYLLSVSDLTRIRSEYHDLLGVVNQAVPIVEIDVRKHIKFEIFEWIHRVQTGIVRQEINNIEDLKRNAKVNYELYKQILEIVSFNVFENRTFNCQIKLNESLLGMPIQVDFDQNTTAHIFTI